MLSYLGISANGRRLAFVSWRDQSDVYLGELERSGTRLAASRRLTFDLRTDRPSGWLRDSRTVLFSSDRNGGFDVFRQSVSDRAAQAVVSGPEEESSPRLSPDGAWILYLARPNAQAGIRRHEGRLMRVPVSGGQPLAVIRVAGYRGPAHGDDARLAPELEGHPGFRCPSAPGTVCVLTEQSESQLVFTAFDPIAGRQGELFRIDTEPSNITFWDLSPDGKWIALGSQDQNSGRMRILSLSGRPVREISDEKWKYLESVAWAADGKALFLTGWGSRGSQLSRLSLDSQADLLYTAGWMLGKVVPSPDGRYLAFGERTLDSNAWVIENFR